MAPDNPERLVMLFPMFHAGGLIVFTQGIKHGATLIIVPMYDFEQFLRLNERYKVVILIMIIKSHLNILQFDWVLSVYPNYK